MKSKKVKYLSFPVYFWSVAGIDAAGLADSLYLSFSHYRAHSDILYTSFCTVSGSFNCDTVSQSIYSIFLGLPVPVWGIAGYTFFLMLLSQAVTYIVQRMAALAAMFYIIGIYCYLKARFGDSWTKRLLWSLGVAISFLLAVGSKENASMFPIPLLLVEIVFFQNMAKPEIRKKMMALGIVVLFAVFFSGIWLFLSSGFINSILSGYENRTFTFAERVLTQPRIVIFYLSQIFYPIADRLSLDHDIVVSTGLFSPWTTFASIVLILGLISIAIWQIKRRPLLGLAILYFFLNHIVESSVISLELIFEHRNYLPSLFLFLPVAAGLKKGIDHYLNKRHSKIMGGMLISFCTILMVMFGSGTYVRNMAWASGKTLWEDTIEKAPGRARAYQNLSQIYYEKSQNYDQVLELSKKSMYLADSTRNKAELISLANMANVHSNRKNFEKAIELSNRILSIAPENHDIRYRLVLAKIRAGQMENVTKHIDELISEKPDSDDYLNLKALMGEYVSAERYLKRVPGPFNRNMTALFLLIENSIRSGDSQKAETYADYLLSGFTTDKILNSLDQTNQTYIQWPFLAELIVPVILERLEKNSEKSRNWQT